MDRDEPNSSISSSSSSENSTIDSLADACLELIASHLQPRHLRQLSLASTALCKVVDRSVTSLQLLKLKDLKRDDNSRAKRRAQSVVRTLGVRVTATQRLSLGWVGMSPPHVPHVLYALALAMAVAPSPWLSITTVDGWPAEPELVQLLLDRCPNLQQLGLVTVGGPAPWEFGRGPAGVSCAPSKESISTVFRMLRTSTSLRALHLQSRIIPGSKCRAPQSLSQLTQLQSLVLDVDWGRARDGTDDVSMLDEFNATLQQLTQLTELNMALDYGSRSLNPLVVPATFGNLQAFTLRGMQDARQLELPGHLGHLQQLHLQWGGDEESHHGKSADMDAEQSALAATVREVPGLRSLKLRGRPCGSKALTALPATCSRLTTLEAGSLDIPGMPKLQLPSVVQLACSGFQIGGQDMQPGADAVQWESLVSRFFPNLRNMDWDGPESFGEVRRGLEMRPLSVLPLAGAQLERLVLKEGYWYTLERITAAPAASRVCHGVRGGYAWVALPNLRHITLYRHGRDTFSAKPAFDFLSEATHVTSLRMEESMVDLEGIAAAAAAMPWLRRLDVVNQRRSDERCDRQHLRTEELRPAFQLPQLQQLLVQGLPLKDEALAQLLEAAAAACAPGLCRILRITGCKGLTEAGCMRLGAVHGWQVEFSP